MGTYAKFYLEKRVDGEWESCYVNDPDFITAHKMAESQDYFKFAFLSGVRNYYLIKSVTKKSELVKRPEDVKESIREEWGLNEPRFGYGLGHDDDIYEYFAKYEVSMSSAKELGNGYNYLSDVYLIDDLLEFDYTREIEYDIIPGITYLHQRFLEEYEKTYLDRLEYFLESIKVLKSFGVERILIAYD